MLNTNKLLCIVFLITLSLFFGCKTGDDNKEEEEKQTQTPEEAVGGFSFIDNDSELALTAYTFLQKELEKTAAHITLGEITEAKVQVVAGTNTVITCNYTNTDESTSGLLSAEIYEDLDKKQSLTSLDWH